MEPPEQEQQSSFKDDGRWIKDPYRRCTFVKYNFSFVRQAQTFVECILNTSHESEVVFVATMKQQTTPPRVEVEVCLFGSNSSLITDAMLVVERQYLLSTKQ